MTPGWRRSTHTFFLVLCARQAIKIFYWLLVTVYGTDLHELCAGKMLQLTIDYGFSEMGTNGTLTYASGYVPLKTKNKITRVATNWRHRYQQLRQEQFSHDYCLILGGYLQPWGSDPMRDSLATLLEGLKMGNKNGHIDNASICGSLLCSYSLFSGDRLESVLKTMNSFAEWAKEERLYGR